MDPSLSLASPGEVGGTQGRAWLLAAFVLALVVLAAAAWMSHRQSLRTERSNEWVRHTLEVREHVALLAADLLRMEAEHRGFLLRGEERFATTRDAYRQKAQASLTGLQALSADNPEQQVRLREVGRLLDQRRVRMQAITEMARREGIEAARENFNPTGVGSIEPVNAAIAAVAASEARLYDSRASTASDRAAKLRNLLLLGPGIGIALLALGLVSLLRQLRRSESLAHELARDIHARRAAEQERDLFFDLSLDMLCVAGPDGYFKRISPAFTSTLGWSHEELTSQPFARFVHPEDLPKTMEEVRRQLEDGLNVLDFENRYLHKDGSWRVLSWKSAPQPDGRMYASARDITDRQAAEARTLALNEELTAQQAELLVANQELESFSYSVSHDLRAPLRHIDGYARMLSEDAGDQLPLESQRYLRTIIASARRMGLLIDDLLAFSRLSRKPLNEEMVDMNDLVDTALAEVRSTQRGDANVEVALLPSVPGDPALLRQVWINLLSNAFKYSGPRGEEARIWISAERTRDEVHFRVRDNGVGFDMRYADKLFGVFQRLHGQDQFEGTGVGLAIVQRIIARHGGRVSATGEVDRGACITFSLPGTEASA